MVGKEQRKFWQKQTGDSDEGVQPKNEVEEENTMTSSYLIKSFIQHLAEERVDLPITENRRFLEGEFVIILKVLKSNFSRNGLENNVPEFDDSKMEAKRYRLKSPKNTKNQALMMQVMRCVTLLKKKAKRIKERNKSEDAKDNLDSTIKMLHN